jgi:DNA replication protein DnaC
MMTSVNLIAVCRSIGLRASTEAIQSFVTHAAKAKLSPAACVEALCILEQRERGIANLQRRRASATLGHFKSPDQFDWNHPRVFDRTLFNRLLETLDFMKSGENILLRGQPGIGKTTLSQYLGMRAIERGHTVLFCTLPAALADLMRQESLPATQRRLKRYTNPDLLILDELGYVPCDSRAADLLFHIVSNRHERKSTIITTNLAYKLWPTMFRDASCLGALIDRFAQHCHTLDIDADSWRATGAEVTAAKSNAATKRAKLNLGS